MRNEEVDECIGRTVEQHKKRPAKRQLRKGIPVKTGELESQKGKGQKGGRKKVYKVWVCMQRFGWADGWMSSKVQSGEREREGARGMGRQEGKVCMWI
jgi:hypothetical protein